MKNFLFLLLYCGFVLLRNQMQLNGQWAIHRANPGQFASIQAALDAPNVMPGDTLLIQPTPIRHPDFELTKRLVFIGEAIVPVTLPGQITTLTRVYVAALPMQQLHQEVNLWNENEFFRSWFHNGNVSDISVWKRTFWLPHCPNESGIQFSGGSKPVNMLLKIVTFNPVPTMRQSILSNMVQRARLHQLPFWIRYFPIVVSKA